MRPASRTARLTLCAILTALSVAGLYFSALSPMARWGLVAVAALFPTAAVISAGLKGGLAVWAAAGLLGLLILPDKLNALLYLLFFGVYPVVKSLLERRLNRWLCFFGKLAFFNAVAALLVAAFSGLFLPALPWDMQQSIHLVFLWGSVVFIAYDYGLSKLIQFYIRRVSGAVDRHGENG